MSSRVYADNPGRRASVTNHSRQLPASASSPVPPTASTPNPGQWAPESSFTSPRHVDLAVPHPVASPHLRSTTWQSPMVNQEQNYTGAFSPQLMQASTLPTVGTARNDAAQLQLRRRRSRPEEEDEDERSVYSYDNVALHPEDSNCRVRRGNEGPTVDVRELSDDSPGFSLTNLWKGLGPSDHNDPEYGRRASGQSVIMGNGEGQVTMRRESWWNVLSGWTPQVPAEPKPLNRRQQRQRGRKAKGAIDVWELTYNEHEDRRLPHTISVHATTVHYRQKFIIKLAKALMTFGAPSHRIEKQLREMSRTLELELECIHLPSVVLISFKDDHCRSTETFMIRQPSGLALGNLHEVHQIYRNVLHDEIGAREGIWRLDELMAGKPAYKNWARCFFAFMLSLLICPLAFGGSFVDMWIAGLGSLILCTLSLTVVQKSQLYANVFEITMTIVISFVARALGSIRSDIFCYDAISSAGIVSILPGFLILSSSLELASKNILCGSVKMVYALTYTLFLGFGLQIGSDFYLLFDHGARTRLDILAAAVSSATTYSANFVTDNSTIWNSTSPLVGTFTITNASYVPTEHIIDGCMRPLDAPWYLQPFPWWTQFLIVPLFATLSSLANLQPVDLELITMVAIACISYSANKLTNVYIHNRSDIVSAIGAFTVGVLGTIYGRTKRGTPFTAMITGILFLVPSGLSQGGMMTNGNGIDIGGAMIAVTIGITVGIYLSQTLVYLFGAKRSSQWGF